MKRLFLLLIYIIASFSCYAQKLTLSESTDFSLQADDFNLLGKQNNDILIYLKKNNKPAIIFYNENMQIKKSIDLDLLPQNYSNIKFICQQDKLLLFYETKENKLHSLNAIKLLPNHTWSQPLKLLEKPISYIKEESVFKSTVSENKKFILFYNNFFSKDSNQLQAIIINDELTTIRQINQSFSNSDFFNINKAILSNSGLAYITANNKINNRGNIEELKLLTLHTNTNHFDINPIKLDNKYVSDIQINIDNKNDNIYLTSFFSDNKYYYPRGIYTAVFNIETKKIISNYFIPITLQLSKSNTLLKDFKLKNILIKEDGSVEAVIEKYFNQIRSINDQFSAIGTGFTISSNNNSRSVNDFYYDEVYIFNFKNDGSMAWSQIILKEQLSTDDGGIFSSFYIHKYPTGNIYLFNDLSTKITRLLACYLSAKGDIQMKEIQTNQTIENWNLIFRSTLQISKSELIVPCLMKKNISFLKITF